MAKVVTKTVFDNNDNVVIVRLTDNQTEAERAAFEAASKYAPLIKHVDEEGSTYTGHNQYLDVVKVEVWDDSSLTDDPFNQSKVPQ